jgi:hypothetical protein
MLLPFPCQCWSSASRSPALPSWIDMITYNGRSLASLLSRPHPSANAHSDLCLLLTKGPF